MSRVIDMRQATADEKEQLLGREFRELDVIGFKPMPPFHTILFLEGERVELVGDPQKALATYLAGKSKETLQ